MFRHMVRSAARRAPKFSVARTSLRAFPVVQTNISPLQYRTFAKASDPENSTGEKPLDDILLNADIDALEKHMREFFGDHATWDHEKLLNLVYVEQLFPLRHIMEFANYASGGHRPGGGVPSFPLLTQEEFLLMEKPYSQWAPKPYNTIGQSLNDRVLPLFQGDTIEGLEVGPSAEFTARLRPLKAKLSLGMAPISHDRWLERKMDDPTNHHNLFELMRDVELIFQWLNWEEIVKRTRNGYNWVVEKHVEFERAANLRREQNGISEKLDLAGMWAEYWHDTTRNMSDRTHRWFVDRVDEVQARAFAEYQKALNAAGSDDGAIGEAGKRYYDCVQDLRTMITKLDYTIGVPMTGFKGYKPSNDYADLPLSYRHDLYSKMIESKTWKHQSAILDAQDQENMELAAKPPPSMSEQIDQLTKPAHPRFRDSENFIGHYTEGKQHCHEIRTVLRGEPRLPNEDYWITVLQDTMDFYRRNKEPADSFANKWGFVFYRLTYNQTDEEWAAFMEKLMKDLTRSGQWIEGWDNISSTLGIEVVDGRLFDIPEGDIEAAKRHFKSTYTMPPIVGRMWSQDFFAIDAQSYSSYAEPKQEETRPPPPFRSGFGSNGGHVRLVDTAYGMYPQHHIDATSPGYKGELKVLSTLVYEEVYPLLATHSLRPLELWPLARLHPREVYVGTTDHAQEAWWEFERLDRVGPLSSMFDGLRKQKADLLAKKL